MATHTETSHALSPAGNTPVERPEYHTGIGITQWLAWGLIAFSVFMVIMVVVINLFVHPSGT